MPPVDLVCLANSTKMGGRCVAGLRVDGKGWIRPIAPDTAHGQLYFRHLRLKRGGEPEMLDVITVDLERYTPSPNQPENWLMGPQPWILKKRTALPELLPLLRSYLMAGPLLLGSTQKQIRAQIETRILSSLALVAPSNVRWSLEKNTYGRPQPRALFELRGQEYNLPVTDPAWTTRIVRKFSQLEPGIYPQEILGIAKSTEVWFTISLSEPFDGYCYKLVAAIIVLPELWNQ